MKKLLLIFVSLFLTFGIAFADQLEDGLAAYKDGDYVIALKLLRPLAKQGNAKAQYHLSIMYEQGQGVTQDHKEALKWYHPKTISTGVEYLHAPKLEYPSLARRMGEEGRVALRVLIDENGHPTRVDVQKTSGFARLDSAAQQAVLHATFKPHIENGKATAVYVILPFDFHLDN